MTPPPPQSMIITSRLHDLARVYNWEAVIARSMSHPKEASYLGPDRLNALHHVCNRRPPADAVEALLRADAKQAEVQDVKGWTALHYACRFKANPMVVQHLLGASRASSMLRDLNGRIPLWYAIRYDAPQEVVKHLVYVFPGSVMQCDHAGASPISHIWTPFATSFVGKRHIDETIDELEKLADDAEQRQNYQFEGKPKLGKIWKRYMELLSLSWQNSGNSNTNNGSPEINNNALDSCNGSCETTNQPQLQQQQKRKWLMLHAISSFPCHIKMWKLAKALNREQAFEVDQDTGRLPLHFVAASTGLHGENCRTIIRQLLELNPAAARHLDNAGNTPLAIAVQDKQWEEDGLVDLFEAYPEALRIADHSGRLPLHTAASTDSAQPCVVRYLLKHYIEAAQTPDAINGALPLHHSLCSGYIYSSSENDNPNAANHSHNSNSTTCTVSSCESSKYMVIYQAYPAAIQTRDITNNRLPLHYACASIDASPHTITQLIDWYPNAVQTLDKHGKTPLLLACESGKDWDTGLAVLIQAFPQGVSRMDHRGFLPFHVLAMSTTCSSSSSSTQSSADNYDADLSVLSTMFRLLMQDPSCFAAYCICNE
mmetsp:Transcript_12592/g.18894  ORF Transcript_12592/g.18894 Transcript_12592/m.18894 type:complete len:599 (-) Transcript_12592:209-2005(-)|eukprot:CAMPEP_0196807482 /NCGR_PEP_ID=MMETSP1362-20130617/7465_1 /TAXON_ID=163516 /ORGANISM="Leptocylindrus danicus, Strain CCMP1856" /LENGTH=598 /DNA_ID=CAMNT_0042181431 /DNA_START=588 /DNA_END=2384 /DNA_ORIENTATION=+